MNRRCRMDMLFQEECSNAANARSVAGRPGRARFSSRAGADARRPRACHSDLALPASRSRRRQILPLSKNGLSPTRCTRERVPPDGAVVEGQRLAFDIARDDGQRLTRISCCARYGARSTVVIDPQFA
jgi:hypothetical protein